MCEDLATPELVQQPLYGYVVSFAGTLARGPCHLRGSGKIVRPANFPGPLSVDEFDRSAEILPRPQPVNGPKIVVTVG